MMSDNFPEIDTAMNMIKEDIIKELYESVSKQNQNDFYNQISTKSFSFSEKQKDL